LMKAYAGELRKLGCRFLSLKLKHVPHGQDATVKELSRIAAKGLPIPFGVSMENLSQPPAIPEEEDAKVQPTSEQGILLVTELQAMPSDPASERCTPPAQAGRPD
jgi:hypothetical protein